MSDLHELAVKTDTEIAALSERLSRVEWSIKSRRAAASHDHYGRPVTPSNWEQAKIDNLQAQADKLLAELRPLQDKYREHRWNRYFLVTNTNGHVHSSTSCSTCFPTTSYSWLVDLADKPVSEMVEEWGEKACTVCFPEAPTFPRFSQPSRRDQAEQAKRAAEKAEREAKKAAKNLTPEQQFKDGRGWKVTTVAGAKTVLREAIHLANYGAWGDRHPWADDAEAAAVRAREVLLARGVPEAELDRIVVNATKKVRKELGL